MKMNTENGMDTRHGQDIDKTKGIHMHTDMNREMETGTDMIKEMYTETDTCMETKRDSDTNTDKDIPV
jgi:hypothetical protein